MKKTSFVAANVASVRNYEIKTPDVVIKVAPDKAQLVEHKIIDGVPYILIEATDQVEINGIAVRTAAEEEREE